MVATSQSTNAHIWVGNQFVADLGPGTEALRSTIVSEAETLPTTSVKISAPYLEDEFNKHGESDLRGSFAVQLVGTFLVPSVPLDQVGQVLAHRFDELAVRAFIVQRITFENTFLLRLTVFPTSTVALADYKTLGSKLTALLLHEGYSTDAHIQTEVLAPVQASAPVPRMLST